MSRGWGGNRARALTLATLERYGSTCHLCGREGATTADHVIPRSHGGPDTLDNLRPAHSRCNSARGNMSLARWFELHPLDMSRRAPPSRDW
ncbi:MULTISPECIES: HNH endonuclease [Corynebacterium]|uniref:HNH endonuclease n=1 Tax=Corynebacterium hadale TaxID=2026255 RepID=A0A269PFG5_9CORY|nr:HNH endonuclease signature motif containing protein [Corynebacterium hadale]PAJ70929.1 HNH endonuclease [Corynebacterium hadale]